MSKIEWTDETWNPTVGCSKVSPGCKNCYAEKMANRLQAMRKPGYEGVVDDRGRWSGMLNVIPGRLEDPLKWRKPKMVFVNSMSDLFHENVSDETILQVFAVMTIARKHTFQVLTKRPERMASFFRNRSVGDMIEQVRAEQGAQAVSSPADWRSDFLAHYNLDDYFAGTRQGALGYCQGEPSKNRMPQTWPLPNVWLGTSVENQDTANERIPLLAQTPSDIRFVSYEPALGPVDFAEAAMKSPVTCKRPFDWLICGGESGHGARPMHPDWARQARDQCQLAGVAFFFKQWGEWLPISQMKDGDADAYYYPPPERDPEAIRKCRIPTFVMQSDGQRMQGRFTNDCMQMFRVGKKAAGRLLDGREWSEYPKSSTPIG